MTIKTPPGWTFLENIGEDMSPRRYARVERGGRTAVLMDCSGPEIPGHSRTDFVRIAAWLRGAGVHAPDIHEEGAGYLLLEDFGDLSFRRAAEDSDDPLGLYMLASDVLIRLRHAKNLPALPDYAASHVHAGRRRVVDWYAPVIHGRRNPDGWAEDYLSVWDRIEQSLPPCPVGFVHGDYHAENLMLLEGGSPPTFHPPPLKGGRKEEGGVDLVGVLDFQGAMRGPLPYDLANLLEDPRADVSPGVRDAMLAHYCADMTAAEAEAFRLWYRVLATQFHCRVIGQFIKLALTQDKTRYLAFVPRTESLIRGGLEDLILGPLKVFFDKIGLDFYGPKDLNAALKKDLIREDAF